MQAKFIAKLGNIQGDGGEFAVHLAQFRHPAACWHLRRRRPTAAAMQHRAWGICMTRSASHDSLLRAAAALDRPSLAAALLRAAQLGAPQQQARQLSLEECKPPPPAPPPAPPFVAEGPQAAALRGLEVAEEPIGWAAGVSVLRRRQEADYRYVVGRFGQGLSGLSLDVNCSRPTHVGVGMIAGVLGKMSCLQPANSSAKGGEVHFSRARNQ